MPYTPSPAVAGGPASPPHLYNWNPGAQLINFRGAKAQVRSGKAGSRCVLACFGDSTTAGYDGANVNRPVTSYPARLAARLNAGGLPTNCIGFVGSGNYNNGDARIVDVGTGGWSGAAAFGGNMKSATGTANGFDFTPGVAFDRLDIDFFDQGGNSFTIAVDGGTAQTITNTGTNNMRSVTLSLSGSASSVVSYRATANQTYIQGVRPWLTTSPVVEVINGGQGGMRSDGGATQPTGYSQLSGLLAVKPKLMIYNVGINDCTVPYTAAAYGANVKATTTAMQQIGCDVLLCLPTPIASSTGMPLLAGDYYAALKAIADSNNVPVLSWIDRYQSFAKSQSAFGQTDNNHPPYAIYDDEAAFLASLLAAA